MAKGELTILRCLRIADELRTIVAKDAQVEIEASTQDNVITIIQRNGPTLILRPISINPVN